MRPTTPRSQSRSPLRAWESIAAANAPVIQPGSVIARVTSAVVALRQTIGLDFAPQTRATVPRVEHEDPGAGCQQVTAALDECVAAERFAEVERVAAEGGEVPPPEPAVGDVDRVQDIGHWVEDRAFADVHRGGNQDPHGITLERLRAHVVGGSRGRPC